jgi:DegV family protein with EDD domain
MPSAVEQTLDIRRHLVFGLDQLSGWADLLDAINVFPVADGDTGRNLVLSLAPLRRFANDNAEAAVPLLTAARGNSGNIANRFIAAIADAPDWAAVPEAMQRGYQSALRAVAKPMPGTLLSTLERISELATASAPTEKTCERTLAALAESVRQTTDQLPQLKAAGVVDAGALGAYLFLLGFYDAYISAQSPFRAIHQQFSGQLTRNPAFKADQPDQRWCVDLELALNDAVAESPEILAAGDASAVVVAHGRTAKIHVHTQDLEQLKKMAEVLGTIEQWQQEDMLAQVAALDKSAAANKIHIMTDAAGSLSRADARSMGVSLLASYINIDQQSLPETLVDPTELYTALRAGVKVSTAQASDLERRACYHQSLARYDRVIYLCVGSAYTGNVAAAECWKNENDKENRLTVIDSGAASGRLAIAVAAAARFAVGQTKVKPVVRFARQVLAFSEELVFLDRLKYLAAGGRLSRTNAFLGDAIHLKPVVSPMPEGARKVAVVKNSQQQLRLALERLASSVVDSPEADILLQFSDNQPWVTEVVQPKIRRHYPAARIAVKPLSLTSGAHMGPGTWALAYLDRARIDSEAQR